MVKSGRRRKKADKAKVQLKKSIKLPKGANQTNPAVKTRTITVKSFQPSADPGSDATTTRKNLTLPDVLAKINSFSLASRIDGLEGLGELFQKNFERVVVSRHFLGSILSKLLPLLPSDGDRRLRRLASQSLRIVLARAAPGDLEAFPELISVHLSAALSHINPEIQRDSLQVLDTVLEAVPEVVKRQHERLLPDCINQVTSGFVIDQKVTWVQWRSEVLKRIVRILEIVMSGEKSHVLEPRREIFTESNVTASHFPPRRRFAGNETSPDSKLTSILAPLMPVLSDVWCECSSSGVPEKSVSNKKMRRKQFSTGLEVDKPDRKFSNVLGTEHLETLESVLKILDFTVQLGLEQEEKIWKQMMSKFPYNVQDQEKRFLVNSINVKIAAIQVKLGRMSGKVSNFLLRTCEAEEVGHLKEMGEILSRIPDCKEGSAMVERLCENENVMITPLMLTMAKRALEAGNLEGEVKKRLVRRVTKAALSSSGTEDHWKALIDINKLGDEVLDKVVAESIDFEGLEERDDVEGICRTLAILLRKQDDEIKGTFRNTLKCLDKESWTLKFCENVLSNS